MELNQIKKLLIKVFNNDFTVKNRKQEFVYQRSIYFRLCREFTTLPLCDIAASLNKNHATVIHSFKVFDNLELWGETQEQKDAAILIIAKGLRNIPLVADQEINLAATLVELCQID